MPMMAASPDSFTGAVARYKRALPGLRSRQELVYGRPLKSMLSAPLTQIGGPFERIFRTHSPFESSFLKSWGKAGGLI